MASKVRSDAEVQVTSVYIPEHCLQGEDLPAHVLWVGDAAVQVRLELPNELQLKQLFNASPKRSDKFVGRTLTVSGFETPGYLGLLLRATRITDPQRVVRVRFVISAKNGTVLRDTQREVMLFRPFLKSVSTPLTTNVSSVESGRGRLDSRVSVSNAGEGTAIVRAVITSGGQSALVAPTGVSEFVSRYGADVVSGFITAKADYPQFQRLLDRFIQLTTSPPTFDRKSQRILKSTWRMARRAYDRDRGFLERIVTVLLTAYFRNLQLVTEMNSFLDYFNSIGTGRVVVSNALDVVRVKAGSTEVSLELRNTDAALKAYPPINLGTLTITSDVEAEIPVHCFFDWQVHLSDLERRLAS